MINLIKKIIYSKNIFFCCLFFLVSNNLFAQDNDCTDCNEVITFRIDLSQKPDSVWISPPKVKRSNRCCNASSSDRCIRFIVKTSPLTVGLAFQIVAGPAPGGMDVRVNCGPLIPANTPVCINGIGPHCIVYCKPGSDESQYQIQAISKVTVSPDLKLNLGCTGTLSVSGANPSTVKWRSVFPGTAGTYDSFLSCNTGCTTTQITPQGAFPAYVDYEVSALSVSQCSNTIGRDTVRVNLVPLKTISISPTNPTICTGTTMTLTANVTGGAPPYKYIWNNGATTQSVTVAAGSYVVRATDATSCPAVQASTTVTTGTPPVVSAGTNQTVCANGSPITLTGFSPAGGTWSGNGVSASGVFTPSTALIGVQTLTYSFTQNGCTGTATKTVTVTAPPTVSAGPSENVCANGSPITLTGFSPAGGTWSGNGVSAAGVFTPSTALVGVQTLTYSFTQNGCTGTATKTVTVTTPPTVTAGTPENVCANGLPITLAGFSPAGGTWSGNGVSSVGVFTPSTALVGVQTLTYSYTQNGCTTTLSKTITVLPVPTVSAGTNQTVCANGSPITLTGFSPVGGTWSGNGVSASGVFTPSTVLVGVQTLTYSFTQNGCTGTATKTVTVTAPPTVLAGSAQSVCANVAPITLTDFSPAGGTWSGPGVSAAGVFTPTSAFVGVQTLTYSYTQNGCTGTATKPLTVLAPPLVIAGNNESVCVNAPAFTLTGFSPIGGTWSGNGVSASGVFTPSPALVGTQTLTYSVTQNGCTSTASKTLTVLSQPVITAGVNQTICTNAAAFTLSGFSPSGGTWSGNGVSATGVFTPSTALVGTQTLTYTLSINGCSGTATKTVTVLAAPVVNAGANQTVCSNAPALTLSGFSPSGGTWSGNGVSASGVFTPTAALVGTQTLTYTAVQNGCTAFATKVITVQVAPTVLTGGDKTFCSGATVQLGEVAQTGFSYSWSPAMGLSSAAAANPTLTWINNTGVPQALVYSLQVTNLATGCKNTGALTATVNPLPVAIAGKDTTICSGTALVLGTTPVGGYAYNWIPALHLSSGTVANPVFVYQNNSASNQSFVYTLITTNTQTNCQQTAIVKLTVKPKVIVDAGADVAFCSGGTASVGGLALLGHSYTWLPTAGLAQTNVATTVVSHNNTSAVKNDTLHYILTARFAGCNNSDTVRAVVYPTPQTQIQGSVSVCPGITDISYTTSDTLNGSYTWAVVGGTLAKGQGTDSIIVDWSSQRRLDAAVKVVPVSIYGCPGDTARLGIKVQVLLEPDKPNGDTVLCFANRNNKTYQVSKAEGSTYTWHVIGGKILAGQLSNRVTVSWDTIGIGRIYYKEYTTADTICAGFSDTLRVRIAPMPNPKLAIVGQDKPCENAKGVNYSLAGYAGSSYVWAVTGGTIVSGQGTASIGVDWGKQGSYTISVTETSREGCLGTTIHKPIVINPPVKASGTGTICLGDSLVLSAAVGFSKYVWSPVAGLARPTAAVTKASPVQSVTYTVTATDTNGCLSADTVHVTVKALPVADAGKDTAVCSGLPLVLGVMPNALYSYSWSPSANLSANNIPNPVFTFMNATRDTLRRSYTVLVTDKVTGCQQTDSLRVKVYPLPVADACKDTAVCSGLPLVLGIAPSASYGYTWSPSSNLNASNVPNPVFTFQNKTRDTLSNPYILTLTDKKTSCASHDTVRVRVYPLPLAYAGKDTAVCSGQPVQLGELPQQRFSYAWSPADKLSSASLANPVYSYVNNTRDTVPERLVVRVTDRLRACSQTDTVQVRVYPLPIAQAGADRVACSGDTFVLATNPLAGFLYKWFSNVGGLLDSTAAQVRGVIVNDTPAPLDRKFALRVTETRTGCSQTDTTMVQVMPVPVTTFAPDSSLLLVCPQTKVSLLYKASGLPGSLYEWQVTGGTVALGQALDTDSLRVLWDLSPNVLRRVAVREKTTNNCYSAFVSHDIRLDDTRLDMVAVSTSPDNNKQVNLQWKLNNNRSNSKTVLVQRRQSGAAWATLAAIGGGQSTYTDTQPLAAVYEYRLLTTDPCGDTIQSAVHNNMLLQIAPGQDKKSAQLSWNPYIGWANGVLEYRVFRKLNDGTYEPYGSVVNTSTLTYTDGSAGFKHCFRVEAVESGGNGATALSSDTCFVIEHPLEIYNVITPNGDPQNQAFVIKNLSYYTQNKLVIYNRWGKKVYEQSGYQDDWQAQGLPDGTYFYLLTVEATPYTPAQTLKGWVQIIR